MKYKPGDTVRVDKAALYDSSPAANLKLLHDVLCGIAPTTEYDLIVLDTQEKLNAYNEQNPTS